MVYLDSCCQPLINLAQGFSVFHESTQTLDLFYDNTCKLMWISDLIMLQLSQGKSRQIMRCVCFKVWMFIYLNTENTCQLYQKSDYDTIFNTRITFDLIAEA